MKQTRISLFIVTFIFFITIVTFESIALIKSPVESGPPKYGGIIKYAQLAGPGGYDLHKRPSWAGGCLVPIYNNLVQFNPEYYGCTSDNIIPDLAKRWEVSADGMTYTFILQKGVKWHDGQPFTADDVVYSLNKMTNPKTGSRVSGYLPEFNEVQKIDTFTVKVLIKYPSPAFLVNLAGAYTPILPKHMANFDNKSSDYLVGTGPFKFKKYIPERMWELERNPNYWRKDSAGRKLPYLDGIQVNITRGTASIDAFMGKRLDIWNPIQILQTEEVTERIRKTLPDTVFSLRREGPPYMIYLNTRFAPFKDPRVRRAIGLIYRQEDQILARFGSLKMGAIGRGILGPQWGLSKEDVWEVMGWNQSWKERIAEAQKLMRETGYEKGFKIRLLHGKYPGGHSESSFIVFADKLKRYLNIESELKGLKFSELYKDRAKGSFEMINEVIYALIPDPNAYQPYFYTGSRANFTKYSNPEVDRLFDQQAKELNIEKRRKIVQEIERILLKDRFILPGSHLNGYRVWHPWVKNIRYTGSTYSAESKMEEVWMEKH